MTPAIIFLILLLHSVAMLSTVAAVALPLASDSVNAGYAYYEQGGSSNNNNNNNNNNNGGGGPSATEPANGREIATIGAVAAGVLVSIVWFVWWRVARGRAAAARGKVDSEATTATTVASEVGDAGEAGAGTGAGRGSHGSRGESGGDDDDDDDDEVYGNTIVITAGHNPFRDPPDCGKPLPQDKPLPTKDKQGGEEMDTIAAAHPPSPKNWIATLHSPRSNGGEQHEIVGHA